MLADKKAGSLPDSVAHAFMDIVVNCTKRKYKDRITMDEVYMSFYEPSDTCNPFFCVPQVLGKWACADFPLAEDGK